MTGVFSWLMHRFGLVIDTMWVISFFSTIPERVLLFFVCSLTLGASFFLTRCVRSSLLRFLLPVLTSLVLFLGLYAVFPFHKHTFPRNHPVAVVLSLTLLTAIERWRIRLGGD